MGLYAEQAQYHGICTAEKYGIAVEVRSEA
jgi:hypothetical protein